MQRLSTHQWFQRPKGQKGPKFSATVPYVSFVLSVPFPKFFNWQENEKAGRFRVPIFLPPNIPAKCTYLMPNNAIFSILKILTLSMKFMFVSNPALDFTFQTQGSPILKKFCIKTNQIIQNILFLNLQK